MKKIIALSLLLGIATSAGAETLYQWRDEDGSVVYSDEPPPAGTGPVRVITLPDAPPRPAPAPAASGGERDESGAASDYRERIARREALKKELARARKALEEARKALEQGQEPQPGERAGTAGGGSRLLPAYFDRIERLKARVAEAEKRVEELQKALRKARR